MIAHRLPFFVLFALTCPQHSKKQNCSHVHLVSKNDFQSGGHQCNKSMLTCNQVPKLRTTQREDSLMDDPVALFQRPIPTRLVPEGEGDVCDKIWRSNAVPLIENVCCERPEKQTKHFQGISAVAKSSLSRSTILTKNGTIDLQMVRYLNHAWRCP